MQEDKETSETKSSSQPAITEMDESDGQKQAAVRTKSLVAARLARDQFMVVNQIKASDYLDYKPEELVQAGKFLHAVNPTLTQVDCVKVFQEIILP